MWNWIAQYGGTLCIALVLGLALGAIVVHLIRNKKKGKTSCGCGCENCAMRGECHQ